MTVPRPLEPIDLRITHWMARYGITLTRLAVGIVFLWFGALKFVPGGRPAEDLAMRTIDRLTGGAVPPSVGYPMLATWEVLIGLGLLAGKLLRITLFLLFAQMIGTLLPLFLFPGETFAMVPFRPTLEGQYIIKNLVIIGAGLIIGATVRGGYIYARPPA